MVPASPRGRSHESGAAGRQFAALRIVSLLLEGIGVPGQDRCVQPFLSNALLPEEALIIGWDRFLLTFLCSMRNHSKSIIPRKIYTHGAFIFDIQPDRSFGRAMKIERDETASVRRCFFGSNESFCNRGHR